MPTTDIPVPPFADLPAQFLEASSRAITASADLYTEVLRSQADATAGLFEAYLSAGRSAAATGDEAAATVEEAATRTARGTARATRRATRRTAGATRKAASRTRKAAAETPKAAGATTRKAAATTRKAAAATRRAAAPAKALEAPVSGYDDLTAEELVAKLPELSQAQLAEVTAYERAHDARATVLDRVAALSGPEPAPGYDELTADDAQKLVTGGDAELAAAVRDYERRHKDRASVVEAAVRKAEAA